MATVQSQAVGPDQMVAAARRAAVDAQAKQEVARAAIELRDEWVIRLVDAGVTMKMIGQAVLMSPARVHQIIAAKG